MPRGALEFRPPIHVLLAYIIAPVASALALWLAISLIETSTGHYSIDDTLEALPIFVTSISLAGLIAELCVATPLLAAFRRYRWAWMNAWWFAGFGLATGEACNLLLEFLGPRQWFGWGAVLQGISVAGFLGLIAAVVFYPIAFRRASAAKSTPGSD